MGDLLGKHESASRYLATVELERLPINILKEVLEKGLERFDAKVPDSISMRVAYISDGFAHFTHLIGLEIAVGMIEESHPCIRVEVEHYCTA